MKTLFDQAPPPQTPDYRDQELQRKISALRREMNEARQALQSRKRDIMRRYVKGNQPTIFGIKATGPNSKYAMGDLFGGPDLRKNNVERAIRKNPEIDRLRRSVRAIQQKVIRLEALRDRIRGTENPQQRLQLANAFGECDVESVTP